VLLDVVAFRLYLGSSRGMSRRGRRDVEEGIVRDDIPGSRNLGSRDYWVGVRELGELVGVFPKKSSQAMG
jgi:hypothetical protein